MSNALAYLRVSTQRQHRSGLGIEAQRVAVTRFADAEGLAIIAEFVEAETGKGSDALDRRPSLRRRWQQPAEQNAAYSSPSSTGFPPTSRSCPG
jgi:hypothetical protein